MTDQSKASAVLVTRGDQELTEIVDSLQAFDEIIIWNNTLEDDCAVYGRYAGIEQARNDIVYVQDDDCVLTQEALEELAASYRPGVLTCNVPERFRPTYNDSGLVGFGAIFDRHLPDVAFQRFQQAELRRIIDPLPLDTFSRRCDNVFTALTPLKFVDLPYRDLDWASAPGRMWTSEGHVYERDHVLDLARVVRAAHLPADW